MGIINEWIRSLMLTLGVCLLAYFDTAADSFSCLTGRRAYSLLYSSTRTERVDTEVDLPALALDSDLAMLFKLKKLPFLLRLQLT